MWQTKTWHVATVLILLWGCSSSTDSNTDVESDSIWLGGDAADQDSTGSGDTPSGESITADLVPADTEGDQETTIPYPKGPDGDKDGIPDQFDLFPDDASLPGVVLDNTVYMHTKDELWTLNVKTYKLDFAAFFQWPSDGNLHRMTDIAIDRWGVLYGVSFDALYVVHPANGQCWRAGTLPENFNALTMVPRGVLDPDRDVLVGVSGGGGWYRLDPKDGTLEYEGTLLGEYGTPYTSSGDAYSIADYGTFASVNKAGEAVDYLVEVNPANGNVLRELTRLDGYTNVYGLAGWRGRAMAFDEGGAIIIVDTNDGTVLQKLVDTPKQWWGAGVRTVLGPHE
jgi:hypothetical protein